MLSSCEDFLDRPTEDNPTAVDFYKSEAELKQAVNPLYCIAWFDFQRMWIDAGDVLAGNYGKGSSNIYTNLNMSTASTNDILTNGYGALNAVISMANIAMTNMDANSPLDKAVINKYKGEAMLMKAMAYFYIVRLWGQSPIIDDNVKIIGEGQSYNLTKNTEDDIYKYIITVLQKAAEYLPESNDAGRVDKYSAYGLLSKVYLYYACFKGKDSHLLDQSLYYAGLVENSSHGKLEPVYGKLFRPDLRRGYRRSLFPDRFTGFRDQLSHLCAGVSGPWKILHQNLHPGQLGVFPDRRHSGFPAVRLVFLLIVRHFMMPAGHGSCSGQSFLSWCAHDKMREQSSSLEST
jgi:hypothetical protein